MLEYIRNDDKVELAERAKIEIFDGANLDLVVVGGSSSERRIGLDPNQPLHTLAAEFRAPSTFAAPDIQTTHAWGYKVENRVICAAPIAVTHERSVTTEVGRLVAVD